MLNKVILMGRLTADPELRYTASNVAVIRFTVAVDRRYVRQGEERQTDFINCVAWRQLAEHISKYYAKGRMINIIGSLQNRSWEDQQTGQKRYATEVIADEVNFCGDRPANGAQSGGRQQQGDAFAPQSQAAFSNPAGDGFIPVEADDDLPF